MSGSTSSEPTTWSATAHHIVQRNEKGMLPALTSLNGIRFIAAFSVFLFHSSLAPILAPFSDPQTSHWYYIIFSKTGWVSVSMFFILSGFVMGWSSRPVDHPLRFYKRRFAKIYPVNVVVMVVIVASGVISLHRPDIWLPNLLLVQTWIPRAENYIGGNTPSWFLCAIILFYVIFPVIFRWVKAIPASQLWTTIFICYLGMILSQVVIFAFTHNEAPLPGWPFKVGAIQWWISYTFPLTRVFEFVIGLVLSRIILEGYFIRISTFTSTLLLIVSYVIDINLPFQFSYNLITLYPLVWLLGSLTVGDIKGKTSFLNSALMQWLGNISFGFYMIHFTVLMLLKRWSGGKTYNLPDGIMLLVLAAVVSVILGWILYQFVEIPCGNYLNGRRKAKPQVSENRQAG